MIAKDTPAQGQATEGDILPSVPSPTLAGAIAELRRAEEAAFESRCELAALNATLPRMAVTLEAEDGAHWVEVLHTWRDADNRVALALSEIERAMRRRFGWCEVCGSWETRWVDALNSHVCALHEDSWLREIADDERDALEAFREVSADRERAQ